MLTWARDYGGRSARRMSQFVLEALDLPPATPVEALRPSVAERLARNQHPGSPAHRCRRAAEPGGQAADAELRAGQRLPGVPGQVSLRPSHPDPDPGLASDGLRAGAARGRPGVPPTTDGRAADVAGGAPCGARTRPGSPPGSSPAITRRRVDVRRATPSSASGTAQQADPATPTAVELEFTAPFGRDRVRGRYDRVDTDASGRVDDRRLQVERRARRGHGLAASS